MLKWSMLRAERQTVLIIHVIRRHLQQFSLYSSMCLQQYYTIKIWWHWWLQHMYVCVCALLATYYVCGVVVLQKQGENSYWFMFFHTQTMLLSVPETTYFLSVLKATQFTTTSSCKIKNKTSGKKITYICITRNVCIGLHQGV